MASKRRPIHSTSANSKMNFRPPNTESEPGKGTRPLPEPSSVQNILLFIIQHGCKKVLFLDMRKRLVLYFGVVFFLSLVVDFIPTPKTYFSRKDNVFNLYFVKVAWGWTLMFSIPFVALTSFTYCCGRRERVLSHLSRIVIATFFWFFWTNMFNFFENSYGRCNLKDPKAQTKSVCLGKGSHWQSIDISGHCFILIYSTLMLIEEARVIISWDTITDLIRDEEHARSISDTSARQNTLKNLEDEDLISLKAYYVKFTPFIRVLFFGITCLCILWDMMLFSTIIYFHNMLEKFVACLTAVLTWFLTYKVWYSQQWSQPYAPGEGLFRYRDTKAPREPKLKSRASFSAKVPGPKFMGMPLRVPEDNTASGSSLDDDKTDS